MTPPIRSITEEEKPLAEALYRNAYRVSTDTSQLWTSLTELSTTRAIIDEGRVLSMLTIKPFEIWVGGSLMKMGGIGGVATWADQQGKGYAGELVQRAIADMREAGQAISILYPFSFQFYGHFGYELANEYVSYSATPAEIAHPATDDNLRIRPVNFDLDMPGIQACYRNMAPRWNTMVDRSDKRWQRWKDYWNNDNRQPYVIESLADRHIAGHFSVVDNALPDGGFESTVTELMLENEKHYALLSRFLHRLPTNVKKIKIIGPASPHLWYLFKEPTVTTQLHACYQARVVDIEAACMQRGYAAEAQAEVDFAIQDNHGSWNEGNWTLAVRDGHAEIRKNPANSGSALTLSIQQFSGIFVGYRRATDFVHLFPGQTATLEALDKIFFDRPTRLLDFF